QHYHLPPYSLSFPTRRSSDLLVDDLLDVSRITRGKITLQNEPVDLAAVVAAALESSRPLIEARRHDLQVSVPPEPVRVEGDLTRSEEHTSELQSRGHLVCRLL